MQAIRTRYRGPTNTRGIRIVASCDAGTYSMPRDMGTDIPDAHHQAALALATKLGWLPAGWSLASGALKNGDYCHVLIAPSEAREMAKTARKAGK